MLYLAHFFVYYRSDLLFVSNMPPQTVLIEHTLSTGALRRMFLGHEAAVQTVDFNTHIVISCDAHTTALLHDRQSGTQLRVRAVHMSVCLFTKIRLRFFRTMASVPSLRRSLRCAPIRQWSSLTLRATS